MSFKLLSLLFLIPFVGYGQKQRAVSTSAVEDPTAYEKALTERENIRPNRDTFGAIISTVKFSLKATKEEMETFTDGIVPWISIDSPEKQIPRLIDSKVIAIPYKEVTVVVDYPLSKPASFTLTTSAQGFTTQQLIEDVSKLYHQIYEEEEQSAITKTLPMNQRKMMNRNQTDGKYGIWGHDLSDLDLNEIEVHQNAQQKIYLILSLES